MSSNNLPRLREWAQKMLEIEAKATPAPWTRKALVDPLSWGIRGGVNNIILCEFVGGEDWQFYNAETLTVSRNSFRPFLEYVLREIDAVEKCDFSGPEYYDHCAGTGELSGGLRTKTYPCPACSPKRASLSQLAEEIFGKEGA